MNTKETNPKDGIGFNKSPMFSYIPRPVIAEVGLAMMEGGHKYGRHNYRPAGVIHRAAWFWLLLATFAVRPLIFLTNRLRLLAT